MSRKENRVALVKLFESGKTPADIVKLLLITRRTVYYAIQRYKELGTMADSLKLTATTPANLNKLRCRILRNPGKSLRKLAEEMKLNKEAVRRMVRNGQKLRRYKLGMGLYLNKRMKRVRLESAQRLLKKMFFKSILFTDKSVRDSNIF